MSSEEKRHFVSPSCEGRARLLSMRRSADAPGRNRALHRAARLDVADSLDHAIIDCFAELRVILFGDVRVLLAVCNHHLIE